MTTPTLILASTSKYRKALLERLKVPFLALAPLVDETPLPNETPLSVAQRLALSKAQAIANDNPNAFVIGSDQVLAFHGKTLGKPNDHETAVAMLTQLSGQSMQFHTAVTVIHQGKALSGIDTVSVTMKQLSQSDIETYLQLDKPYDCAGSCKSESLGIMLCERIETNDPTSQIGLPLILTTRLLAQLGYHVLKHAGH